MYIYLSIYLSILTYIHSNRHKFVVHSHYINRSIDKTSSSVIYICFVEDTQLIGKSFLFSGNAFP